VCSLHTRTREDLVFANWLPNYLSSLREFNKYGDFDDPELAISIARSVVNLSSSEESHLYFTHEANRLLHMRMFREPWIGLGPGEIIVPEPIEWVFHLAKLTTHEEAPRLGLAMLVNLTTSVRLGEVVFAKKGLDLLIDRLASQDVAMQRMAAAAIWNLSKSEEILEGISRYLSVSDTLERMASKGVPLKRPPATVLVESLPSILREASVNLGELNCDLGGEPHFCLGVSLASTGMTVLCLKPFQQDKGKEEGGFSKAKLSVTRNPQIDREEAGRRLLQKRKNRAETERRLLQQSTQRMTFQEVRDDLTAFGLDVEDIFDRELMNAELVDLMLSDSTRASLALPERKADERAAAADAKATTVTIKDSTDKGLLARKPRRK